MNPSNFNEAYVRAEITKLLRQTALAAPGRLFRDIVEFHRHFGLDPTESPSHELSENLQRFRLNFLLEELQEYEEAIGFVDGKRSEGKEFDPEKAFDALIDLVYVALGTAYLHGFPFDEGWERVHLANMTKVRAKKEGDSARGGTFDIIKPAGWKPAELIDLLRR